MYGPLQEALHCTKNVGRWQAIWKFLLVERFFFVVVNTEKYLSIHFRHPILVEQHDRFYDGSMFSFEINHALLGQVMLKHVHFSQFLKHPGGEPNKLSIEGLTSPWIGYPSYGMMKTPLDLYPSPKKCIATSGNITLSKFSTKAIPSRLSLKRKKQPQDTHLDTFQAEPGPTSCRGCFQTPLLRWPFKTLKGRYGWSFHSLIPSNPAMILCFGRFWRISGWESCHPKFHWKHPWKLTAPEKWWDWKTILSFRVLVPFQG